MPELHESFDVVGEVKPEIASELGITGTLKVVAGAGDNAAAAVGTGTVGAGGCNLSLGTSGTLFISNDKFQLMIRTHFIHLLMLMVDSILWDVCFLLHHVISGGWMKSLRTQIMMQTRRNYKAW